MKHFRIILISLALLILFSAPGLAGEFVRGNIISTANGRLNVATGGKVATNLGSNSGVIKGDVLKVYPYKDTDLQGATGWCEVTKVFTNTSVCELIKTSTEIEQGNTVTLSKVDVRDGTLYPAIFELMNAVVEPYKASSEIRVRVYDFFDKGNNITRFSKNLKTEVLYVLGQKEKILLKDGDGEKDPIFYPDGYGESEKAIKVNLEQSGIDVIITGTYEKQNGRTVLRVLKIDKNWGDEELTFDFPPDIDAGLTEIVFPFKPVEKRETIVCSVVFRDRNFRITRDMKDEIIRYESRGNVFTNLALKRTEFNIVGVVNPRLKVGNEIREFDANKAKQVSLIEGMNRLTATFRRGYYKNGTLLYTSSREEETEVLVHVKKGSNLNIDIIANPSPGEKLVFKIYKKMDREKLLLRPIPTESGEKTIEMYRD
jgi:hypothetical protein